MAPATFRVPEWDTALLPAAVDDRQAGNGGGSTSAPIPTGPPNLWAEIDIATPDCRYRVRPNGLDGVGVKR